MNLHTNKRSASDDINERRKRRRTISNDLYRGFSIDEIENNEDVSDLSSMSSDSDEDDESKIDLHVPNASSSSQCDRCSKCKYEIPKLMKVHNEVLSLLTELKKKNNEIHKTVRLELQICRQEIIEEVQQLKQSFTRMTDMIRHDTSDDNIVVNVGRNNYNGPESPLYRRDRNRSASPHYFPYSPEYDPMDPGMANDENVPPIRYIRGYNPPVRARADEDMDDDNDGQSVSDTSEDEAFLEDYLR
ncbi:uncharacterized protein LOC116345758 isoform X2 [Contarinia nasturtii]|uniref:uncharacterized protein LOC116345758 isoform X2 n=1 Tax=Contarinia nasturtii TaxID=265458 RepID=UPI0012D37CEB|nr:uncharacterized protein LOC116345758 isoform X2 [Contarinia nasturtii]